MIGVLCSTGGLLVAETLSAFSYDIVRIVLSYTGVLYVTVKPDAQPNFLFSFEAQAVDKQIARGCMSLAISPHDGTLWAGACGCVCVSGVYRA